MTIGRDQWGVKGPRRNPRRSGRTEAGEHCERNRRRGGSGSGESLTSRPAARLRAGPQHEQEPHRDHTPRSPARHPAHPPLKPPGGGRHRAHRRPPRHPRQRLRRPRTGRRPAGCRRLPARPRGEGHLAGRGRRPLRDGRAPPLERVPRRARPRRARPRRRLGPRAQHRGPGTLGGDGRPGIRLGRLLLPARRLRGSHGGRRHRERAPPVHRTVRSAGTHLPARPVLGRERGRQGRRDPRPAPRRLRRGAADQRRARRRFARLRLPGGPAGGLPVLLPQPPAPHRAAVPAVAGPATRAPP